MTGGAGPLHTWQKLSSAKWEDVWPDRLSEFAERLAITALRGAKTIRLEIFALKKTDAVRLQKEFGGSVAMQRRDWLQVPHVPRAPIRVRGQLTIVASEPERAALKTKQPVLVIPAGMAFGTGEHATTATCLRLLADVAQELAGSSWEMLDLGCGSGILALAARQLGAVKVEAADFDPACVRITKENIKSNGLRGVTARRVDVLQWEPERQWPVIAANLFSSLHVRIAPKLAAALDEEGRLIFSGILREQEQQVITAFRGAGLRIEQLIRRGKWTTGVARSRAAARGRNSRRR